MSGLICGFRLCVHWTRCFGRGYRMGIFAFSSLSACAWIGVGEAGTSNPGFPGPEGSIRFIVSVPSCASSPRKSWTALPERVRLADALRPACGERSAHVHCDVVRKHANQEVGADTCAIALQSFSALPRSLIRYSGNCTARRSRLRMNKLSSTRRTMLRTGRWNKPA